MKSSSSNVRSELTRFPGSFFTDFSSKILTGFWSKILTDFPKSFPGFSSKSIAFETTSSSSSSEEEKEIKKKKKAAAKNLNNKEAQKSKPLSQFYADLYLLKLQKFFRANLNI